VNNDEVKVATSSENKNYFFSIVYYKK